MAATKKKAQPKGKTKSLTSVQSKDLKQIMKGYSYVPWKRLEKAFSPMNRNQLAPFVLKAVKGIDSPGASEIVSRLSA